MQGTAKSKECSSSAIGEMRIAWKTRGEKQRLRVATSTTRPTPGWRGTGRPMLVSVSPFAGSPWWMGQSSGVRGRVYRSSRRLGPPNGNLCAGFGRAAGGSESGGTGRQRRRHAARWRLADSSSRTTTTLLVPLADRTAWEGALDASHPHHEYSVPLLVLRNLGRVSEVAERLRQPEPPRIPGPHPSRRAVHWRHDCGRPRRPFRVNDRVEIDPSMPPIRTSWSRSRSSRWSSPGRGRGPASSRPAAGLVAAADSSTYARLPGD